MGIIIKKQLRVGIVLIGGSNKNLKETKRLCYEAAATANIPSTSSSIFDEKEKKQLLPPQPQQKIQIDIDIITKSQIDIKSNPDLVDDIHENVMEIFGRVDMLFDGDGLLSSEVDVVVVDDDNNDNNATSTNNNNRNRNGNNNTNSGNN